MLPEGSLPILRTDLHAPRDGANVENDQWRTTSTAGSQPAVVFSENPAKAAATRPGRVAML